MEKKLFKMNDEILKLREKIDKLDENIITILEKRLKIMDEMRDIKNRKNIPLKIPEREKEITKKLQSLSKINSKMIDKIYKEIFSYMHGEK